MAACSSKETGSDETRLAALVAAAEAHADESGSEHEAGDLSEMLGFCWSVMSKAQRDVVYEKAADLVGEWLRTDNDPAEQRGE